MRQIHSAKVRLLILAVIVLSGIIYLVDGEYLNGITVLILAVALRWSDVHPVEEMKGGERWLFLVLFTAVLIGFAYRIIN